MIDLNQEECCVDVLLAQHYLVVDGLVHSRLFIRWRMVHKLGVEQRHVGQEVEDERCVENAQCFVDNTNGHASTSLLSLILLLIAICLEAVLGDYECFGGAMQFVLAWKRCRVEVVNLANRRESDEPDQDSDWV